MNTPGAAAVFDPRLVAWLAAAAVALLAIGLLGWLWKRKATADAGEENDRLDTLVGWPPQVTRLMTNPERVAFGVLVRALPEYVVLSQVQLARFISVPKRNSYAEWLRRVGNQSVDFLICDKSSQIVAVVNVQLPHAQTNPRASKRQARIARTLKAARVPLHVWLEGSLPPVELARDSILGMPQRAPAAAAPAAVGREVNPGTPVSSASPPTPAARAPGVNPFEEPGRDSTQDEFIEAQEPPPTTWYDEFDSGPTPLAPDKRPRH